MDYKFFIKDHSNYLIKIRKEDFKEGYFAIIKDFRKEIMFCFQTLLICFIN